MDPLTLLALFGPVIKDGASSLIKKWTGEAAGKPANATEMIQIMQAETEQLKVRAQIGDTEGETYKWVIAIIKLQRPAVIALSISAFLLMAIFSLGSEDARGQVSAMVQVIVFWLFGERAQIKLSKR